MPRRGKWVAQLYLAMNDVTSSIADTMVCLSNCFVLFVVVGRRFARLALHDEWEKLYQIYIGIKKYYHNLKYV